MAVTFLTFTGSVSESIQCLKCKDSHDNPPFFIRDINLAFETEHEKGVETLVNFNKL